MLAQLWEENLFLERSEQPGWYRYHEMFAEMLRTQLQEQFPTEIPPLASQGGQMVPRQGFSI